MPGLAEVLNDPNYVNAFFRLDIVDVVFQASEQEQRAIPAPDFRFENLIEPIQP